MRDSESFYRPIKFYSQRWVDIKNFIHKSVAICKQRKHIHFFFQNYPLLVKMHMREVFFFKKILICCIHILLWLQNHYCHIRICFLPYSNTHEKSLLSYLNRMSVEIRICWNLQDILCTYFFLLMQWQIGQHINRIGILQMLYLYFILLPITLTSFVLIYIFRYYQIITLFFFFYHKQTHFFFFHHKQTQPKRPIKFVPIRLVLNST